MNVLSTELVKRQDKMKDGINASAYEGLQSKVEALERENQDLRAQNEEMKHLMKDFESTVLLLGMMCKVPNFPNN